MSVITRIIEFNDIIDLLDDVTMNVRYCDEQITYVKTYQFEF